MIPTQRFTDRVDDYVRARPGYPPAAIGMLADVLRLDGSRTVADVGAGTGISAEALLGRGAKVIAIEPNAAMRAAAAARLGAREGFRAVDGTAEATTLDAASVDAVVAAQAFHWFDRPAFRRECLRILKPGGAVALLWNVRRVEASPFDTAYEALLREHATDYLVVRHENVVDDELAAFFGGPLERGVFDNPQPLDLAGLRARLLSSSYVPAAGDPRCEAMLAALEALFSAHASGGRVVMSYDTRVYAGPLSGTR